MSRRSLLYWDKEAISGKIMPQETCEDGYYSPHWILQILQEWILLPYPQPTFFRNPQLRWISLPSSSIHRYLSQPQSTLQRIVKLVISLLGCSPLRASIMFDPNASRVEPIGPKVAILQPQNTQHVFCIASVLSNVMSTLVYHRYERSHPKIEPCLPMQGNRNKHLLQPGFTCNVLDGLNKVSHYNACHDFIVFQQDWSSKNRRLQLPTHRKVTRMNLSLPLSAGN